MDQSILNKYIGQHVSVTLKPVAQGVQGTQFKATLTAIENNWVLLSNAESQVANMSFRDRLYSVYDIQFIELTADAGARSRVA